MNFQQLNLTNLDYSQSSTDIIINNFSSNLSNSQKQLAVLLKALKQQTFDLINYRYQDFIALSSSLDGCDMILSSLKNELQVDLLKSEMQKITNTSSTINNLLEKKHELAKMNSICVQFEMIDTLFKKLDNDIASIDSDEPSDLSVLMKLSREIGYLYSAVNPYSSHNYIKKIMPRLDSIKNILLQKTLSNIQLDNLSNIFLILSDLDSVDCGVSYLEKNVVQGYISQLDSTTTSFDQALEKILEWVEVDLVKISRVVEKHFNFMELVFAKIMDFVVLGYDRVFMVHDVEQFFKDYQSFNNFCIKFKKLSNLDVYSCNSYPTVNKKWQTSVYFQLMSNEIIGEFEDKLPSDASGSLLTAVDKIWSRCIKATGMKAFRVTILLLKRLSMSVIIRFLESLSSVENKRQVYDSFVKVRKEFQTTISPRISNILELDEHLKSRISLSLSEIFQGFDVNEIENGIVSQICAPVLETIEKGCNGVPHIYRKTNMDKPKSPGYYVKDILAFDDPVWRKRCRIFVLESYSSTVQKCLVNIKNIEESLKKLKKRRMNVRSGLGTSNDTTADNGSNEDSDELKMRLQFQIDLDQVLKDCEEDEIPLLEDLKRLIKESIDANE